MARYRNELMDKCIKMQNRLLNGFLLEFVVELNEYIYDKNLNERLGENFEKLTNLVMNIDKENNPSEAMQSEAKQEAVQTFCSFIDKCLDKENTKFTEQEKYAIAQAVKGALQKTLEQEKGSKEPLVFSNEKNYRAFSQLVKDLEADGSIAKETTVTLQGVYDEAFKKAQDDHSKFQVWQIDVFGQSSYRVAESVSDKMHDLGIIGHGCHVSDDHSFVHVANKRDVDIACALMDEALIKAESKNIISQESLSILADMRGTTVREISDLTAPEAEKLADLAYHRDFPVHFELREQTESKDTYCIQFLESDSKYINKLAVEALSFTNGYSKEAGVNDRMEHNMESREKVTEFINQLQSGKDAQKSCMLLDLEVKTNRDDAQKEAHRLFITKNYFEETRGKETTRIERRQNPQMYDMMLQKSINNFSRHFAFISEDQMKEMHLSKDRFRFTTELQQFINEMSRPGISQETKEAVNYERDFVHWYLKDCKLEDMQDIMADLRENFREKVEEYRDAQEKAIQEKYHDSFVKQEQTKHPGMSKAQIEEAYAKSQNKEIADSKMATLEAKYESLTRDGGKTLEGHLKEMYQAIQSRDLHEKEIDTRTDYVKIEERTDDRLRMHLQNKLDRIDEIITSYEDTQKRSRPDNNIRDTSHMREKTAQSLEEFERKMERDISRKYPNMEPDQVHTAAKFYTQLEDVMHSVEFGNRTILPESRGILRELDSEVIHMPWNRDNKTIMELSNRELKEHMDEIKQEAWGIIKDAGGRNEREEDIER